jgi:hypothetical protein
MDSEKKHACTEAEKALEVHACALSPGQSGPRRRAGTSRWPATEIADKLY